MASSQATVFDRRLSWRRFAFQFRRSCTRASFTALLLTLASAGSLFADNSPQADQAWQVILEQAGGPGTRFHSQAEAMTAARQHLDKQEAALRDFVAQYPSDSRQYSARIRLSSVLHAKSKVQKNSALRESSDKILSDLEGDPATPAPVKADAAFARLSQQMEDMAGRVDDTSRDKLAEQVRRYDEAFHGDRRTAGLLAELATLYDTQPEEKRRLLNAAQGQATDESLRLRIADDLKRLDLLGKPLALRLQPSGGGPAIDLISRRGRVVVLLFWSSWSGPALRELAALMQVSERYATKPVDFYTVSLDEDRAALAATIKAADLHWPVHCDGLGWKGEVVKSLGINALPTVFILDRRGLLTTLNARGTEMEQIESALAP